MPEGAHSLRRKRASGPRAALALLGELIALGAALAGAGCDQGTPHDQPTGAQSAPHLSIVGANVGIDKPLPADGAIQIAFDRFLLPLSVTRQSFVLRDAFGSVVTSPLIVYDPVARVVTLSNPGAPGTAWLTPGQPYRLEVAVPKNDDDPNGPRAIDRATLDPAGAPYVIAFQTGALPKIPTPTSDGVVDYCRDVSPIFQAKCSGGPCHHAMVGSIAPAAGLLLETSAGVKSTAINRVAQGSNTGSRSLAQAPGGVFGIDMPIVTPFDPGNSWLLYKVLLGRPRPVDVGLDASSPLCSPASPPPQPALQLALPMQPLTDDERARLGQWVLGREMPYPLNIAESTPTPAGEETTLPLTFDELERVRAWIAQGAVVDECRACVAQ